MAQQNFTIKKGNSRPKLTCSIVCSSTDTLSSGVFYMRTKTGTAVTLAGSVSIESQPALDSTDNKYKAVISYQWNAADTAAPGVYNGEFAVTFSDGRVETYPNVGYINVEITGVLS